jgi:DNA-binding transcriptional ArsR family regulator
LKKFNCPVTCLAWDENGNHLGVTTYDGVVYLFKEDVEGSWNLVSLTNQEGVIENVKEDEENEENN